MFKINKGNWYQEFDENKTGRDFIVGDLHGYYSLLMKALDAVKFDFSKDRLFSVGDLVDRGPEVVNCLELLKEDWFHATMGNHEYMLLASLGERMGLLNTIQSFLYTDRRRRNKNISLISYLKLIKEMPIVIKVNNPEVPFFITHASRPMKKNIIWDDNILQSHINKGIKNKHIVSMLWGRKVSRQGMLLNGIERHPLFELNQEGWSLEPKLIDNVQPFEASSSLTYSGHTIMDKIVFHRSHVFIDGGRYKGGSLRLIEHKKTIDLIKDYKGRGGVIPLSCEI